VLIEKDRGLEVLAQLANAEITRLDVMSRVRTQNLTVCEFNFSGLPLYPRQKKRKRKKIEEKKESEEKRK